MKKSIFKLLLFILLTGQIFCISRYEPKVYYVEEKKGEFSIYAENDAPIPMQIQVNFTELNNMKSEGGQTLYKVVEKSSSKVLMGKVVKTANNYNFKYSYTYYLGNPNSNTVNNYAYLLPFGHGTKYKVGQGYNGTFSHANTSAIDFNMSQGTPVNAARDGIVVEIKEDSNVGGNDRKYINDANYVLIYHEDGTTAVYAHFKKDGVMVSLGDKVKKGYTLGYSGNTGFSSGAHLHFQVNKIMKMNQTSIPTNFLSSTGQLINLKVGEFYYGYNPSYGTFQTPKTGSGLKNSDFTKIETISTTNKCEVVTEKMDDTTIFYVKNGFAKSISVKIEFLENQNMNYSKSIPYEVKVPANSKMFLFLGNPIDKTKGGSYRYQFTYYQ